MISLGTYPLNTRQINELYLVKKMKIKRKKRDYNTLKFKVFKLVFVFLHPAIHTRTYFFLKEIRFRLSTLSFPSTLN